MRTRSSPRNQDRLFKSISRELQQAAARSKKIYNAEHPNHRTPLTFAENLRSELGLCVRCARKAATFTAPAMNGSWDAICRDCITLDDRWFCGKYPCGLVYADRAIEINGDYKRVAFLPYSTLELEIDDSASPLLDRVKADAAAMQARRGQPFPIAGNMTITLGEKCQ